jgi:TonB-dependent receptor
MAVQAQDAKPAEDKAAAPAQLETVLVTGIRKSLETSVNLKRLSRGLVDGIVAEDIGKFPDTNLAESLSRISGVSIERNNGEGTRITVRGMGPDQNLVLLNGRQMPGSSFDGGAPASRSFDFSNLASDGIAALEVYKTSRASSPTGGMGATVNVRTQRPFDIKETIAHVSAKLVSDETARNVPSEQQGKSATPELNAIYSTVSADGTFGIALMGTYQERDSGYSQAAVTSGWKTFAGTVDNDWGGGNAQWGGLPPAAWGAIKNRPGPTSIYSVPQNLNYAFTGVHRERLNGQMVVQVKPVKDVVATLDFVMSEQKFRQRRNDISAWFNYGGQFGEYQTGSPSSPIIYGETMSGSDVAMGGSRTQVKTKNQQLGLNVKWKASNELKFDFDMHKSSATSGADDPLGTSVVMGTAMLNRNDTFVDFSNKFPVLNIQGGALDASLMQLQGSVFSNSYQKNEVQQVQANGQWRIDGDSSLDFGVALSEVKNRSAFANVQRDSWGANAAGGPAALPDNIWKAESISKYFSGIPGANDPRLYNQFFTFNFEQLRAAAIQALGSDALLKASFNFTDDLRTTEKSESIYGQYNLAWDWGVPMDLSAGLRYEKTKVESPSVQSTPTAVRWAGDNELPVIFSGSTTTLGSGKYSYALPSIDWSADLTDDTKLRLSYGKTIGRPGWNALGGRVLNSIARIDGGTGAVGNPNLKPLQSNNFDFSAEHYYAKGSYVALSYFLKKVKDYNAPVIANQTIAGLTTPVGGAYYRQAIQTGGCAATDSGCIRQWIFTNLAGSPGVDVANRTITGQPGDPLLVFKLGSFENNERKSRINGIELNAQHLFTGTGFGLGGNFTKVKSDRSYDNNKVGAQSDVLPGMGDSGNLVGFYENDTFSARLAYNWRGKFLVANFGGVEGAQPLYVEPYGQVDLGISYNIDKNLRLSFEAINLTDQYVRTHFRNENQIGSVTKLGRRYTIGAVYKF